MIGVSSLKGLESIDMDFACIGLKDLDRWLKDDGFKE
jgi:hypothetical protein